MSLYTARLPACFGAAVVVCALGATALSATIIFIVLVTLLSSVRPVAACLLAVVPYPICLCFAVVAYRRLCCCGNDGNLFGDACFCATSAALLCSFGTVFDGYCAAGAVTFSPAVMLTETLVAMLSAPQPVAM